MSRLGSVATATSAGKAVWLCGVALIDLGIGLWRADPAARRYGQQLRARGKKGGVIGCAMAHRANKIAYAMVRDQSGYDPARWA
jgi:transposase